MGQHSLLTSFRRKRHINEEGDCSVPWVVQGNNQAAFWLMNMMLSSFLMSCFPVHVTCNEAFVADICTLMYNLRVMVIIEQPGNSKFFKYSPVRVACPH